MIRTRCFKICTWRLEQDGILRWWGGIRIWRISFEVHWRPNYW